MLRTNLINLPSATWEKVVIDTNVVEDVELKMLDSTSSMWISRAFRVSLFVMVAMAFAQLSTKVYADGLFDITSFSGAGAAQTAAGTSNGIGWQLSATFISDTNPTITDGTYTRFADPAFFTPSLPNADAIHITGTDFTLTFDSPIKSILFYLSDDAGTANLDLGIEPTLVSGSVGITGTRASPSLSGGVILYDNLSTTSLSHNANVFDGMDLAWVATPVPLPPGLYLFVIGFVAMLRVLRA